MKAMDVLAQAMEQAHCTRSDIARALSCSRPNVTQAFNKNQGVVIDRFITYADVAGFDVVLVPKCKQTPQGSFNVTKSMKEDE